MQVLHCDHTKIIHKECFFFFFKTQPLVVVVVVVVLGELEWPEF
jgi:hypothetical protein